MQMNENIAANSLSENCLIFTHAQFYYPRLKRRHRMHFTPLTLPAPGQSMALGLCAFAQRIASAPDGVNAQRHFLSILFVQLEWRGPLAKLLL
jgi:hypothetical protein